MSKLNFNEKIKTIDGSEYQDRASIGKMLSIILGRASVKEVNDILKIGGWIEKLNRDEELDIDEADVNRLKDLVKNSDVVDAWSKYQILKAADGHLPVPPSHPKDPKGK